MSEPSRMVKQLRAGATNVLAAALVKTSGGTLTDTEHWERAIKTAETVVDAIAEYVIGRSREEQH